MPLTQGQQQAPLYPVICGVVNLNSQAGVIGSTPIFPNAPPGIYHANTCLIVTTTGTAPVAATGRVSVPAREKVSPCSERIGRRTSSVE